MMSFKRTSSIIVHVLFVFIFDMARAEDGKFPLLDISGETNRHVVIAAGTDEIYQGHPTSVMLPDDKTIIAVWSIGHGGHAGPAAKSEDGGKTWTRIDHLMPENFITHINCPSIYRLVDGDGTPKLWVFSAQPRMGRILSEDDGKTWKELPPLGISNVMTFSSIIPKNPGKQDGNYIGFYHHKIGLDGKVMDGEDAPGRLEVLTMETADAGSTWSKPRLLASIEGRDPCEPFAFWSPDEKEICCLMRDNKRKAQSLKMYSRDRGESWTVPVDTAWTLTGDRHYGLYLPDGRLVLVFRDYVRKSPTFGHFIGWVGTYEDIKQNRLGQFRVKLLHSYADRTEDCGYPGIHLLPDGSVFTLTYIQYEPGNKKHSIIGLRFRVGKDGIEKED